MHDLCRLESAIAELSTCPRWKVRVLEKEILLRGSRVYRWTKETYQVLDRQMEWLGTHHESPTYEQRFGEWQELLAEYGRGCRALEAAGALMIGVAA